MCGSRARACGLSRACSETKWSRAGAAGGKASGDGNSSGAKRVAKFREAEKKKKAHFAMTPPGGFANACPCAKWDCTNPLPLCANDCLHHVPALRHAKGNKSCGRKGCTAKAPKLDQASASGLFMSSWLSA